MRNNRNNMNKIASAILLTSLLTACSSFFDKDNTTAPAPLPSFTPEAKVITQWETNTGWGSGSYFNYVPAITQTTIYTASKNGSVMASRKNNGKRIWQVNIHQSISAGPAASNQLVILGTQGGHILALHANDGQIAWQADTSSEILAAPAINNDIVVVKAIDGRLSAFSTKDGHALWHYQQTEPSLMLRAASAPQINNQLNNQNVIAGFANGNLAKLTAAQGNLLWQQPIAIAQGSFAIQRMIDLDADPVIFGNRIYAATYQGQIAALDSLSGKIIWTHDLSSYSGMAVNQDGVYITDAEGQIWAFDRETGRVIWQQNQLKARVLSGPALDENNHSIAVGDAEGYLHWLSQRDGHFVARKRVDLSGIFAAPISENGVIYVFTQEGLLAGYTLLGSSSHP